MTSSRGHGSPVIGPWKTLASWAPGPVAAFINQWFALFAKLTVFTNPDWQRSADVSALALGVVISGVACAVYRGAGRERIRARCLQSIGVMLGAALFCALFFLYMSFPRTPTTYTITEMSWEILYIIMLLAMVTAITFGSLLSSK